MDDYIPLQIVETSEDEADQITRTIREIIEDEGDLEDRPYARRGMLFTHEPKLTESIKALLAGTEQFKTIARDSKSDRMGECTHVNPGLVNPPNCKSAYLNGKFKFYRTVGYHSHLQYTGERAEYCPSDNAARALHKASYNLVVGIMQDWSDKRFQTTLEQIALHAASRDHPHFQKWNSPHATCNPYNLLAVPMHEEEKRVRRSVTFTTIALLLHAATEALKIVDDRTKHQEIITGIRAKKPCKSMDRATIESTGQDVRRAYYDATRKTWMIAEQVNSDTAISYIQNLYWTVTRHQNYLPAPQQVPKISLTGGESKSKGPLRRIRVAHQARTTLLQRFGEEHQQEDTMETTTSTVNTDQFQHRRTPTIPQPVSSKEISEASLEVEKLCRGVIGRLNEDESTNTNKFKPIDKPEQEMREEDVLLGVNPFKVWQVDPLGALGHPPAHIPSHRRAEMVGLKNELVELILKGEEPIEMVRDHLRFVAPTMALLIYEKTPITEPVVTILIECLLEDKLSHFMDTGIIQQRELRDKMYTHLREAVCLIDCAHHIRYMRPRQQQEYLSLPTLTTRLEQINNLVTDDFLDKVEEARMEGHSRNKPYQIMRNTYEQAVRYLQAIREIKPIQTWIDPFPRTYRIHGYQRRMSAP